LAAFVFQAFVGSLLYSTLFEVLPFTCL